MNFTAASPADLSTTLDGNVSVYGLVFNAATSDPVAIASGTDPDNTLAIDTGGVTVLSGAGDVAISAKVTLAGNQTWDIGASRNLTVDGDIGESASGMALTKAGLGTLALNGANAYSGATTVNAGTLTASGASALGATTGSLAVNNPDTGAGTAVILNLSTTAPTTKGSLSGAIAAPSSGNTATINNGGQLFTVNQTSDGAYAGAIEGAGGFTLGSSSTNTLTLSGNNTYTGNTTISAGTLKLGATDALPQGADKGDVTVDSTLDLNGISPTVNGFSGSSTGVVTNTASGPATLTVGGGDKGGTFSGTIQDGTVVSNTTITAGVENMLPWIVKGTLPSGSMLKSVSVDARLDACNIDNWASDLAAYFDPTPEAPGTAALLEVGGYGTMGTVVTKLDWANGGGGPGTTVNDTKTAGTDFPDTIDLSAVQLSVANGYGGWGTWSGSISVSYDNGSGPVVNTYKLTTELISPVGLAKIGTGTMILNGDNTYTGETTVSAGTLALTGSIVSTMLNVAGGLFDASAAASLPAFTSIKGAGTINAGAKTVTLAAGGTLAPGNSPGMITLVSDLDVSATGGLLFELGADTTAGTTYDQVSMAGNALNVGTLDFADFTFTPLAGFGMGTYTLFDAGSVIGSIGTATGTVGGYNATLSITGGDVNLTVIPEPATMAFVVLGGVGLLARRRRRA
ncbi:MAG: autotransporter-associated beta strand repeat-containing protein [Planctomycetota bacterium]|nr:autotransporter-associated beta strand repeat-containing protein [Planctomycetota bacterium]